MHTAKAHGPFEVTNTEHLWIEMPDGILLAARLWLPKIAADSPVPAILEYVPYRKADMVRARDERNHPYFASYGYACLRVDMRGSGDSEGHMPDMYSDNELSDSRHVIDWIAAQPWCDGKVGMFGTSWGGTAALQANIDAPSALKAVIAVCATHDRYEDDIHHMGGCLLTDTFEWGATLPAILAAPPTPNVGAHWMELWRDRLDKLTFPVENWVREESRGQYWRHGSVIHQADRLSRPILAVGGWSDRYSNSVMSLVSARPDLVWGIVGSWGHHYPDEGHPGPAIGFQQVALDWWDRWLKPSAQEPCWPRLRLWLREFDLPANTIDVRNGRWIESDPVDSVTIPRIYYLAKNTLSDTEQHIPLDRDIPADLQIGRAAGDTGYFGRLGGLPLDQAEEDALSLTFETAPLHEDVVLFGPMVAHLTVRSCAPQAQLSLRVNDVAPDKTSARVGLTVRNVALDDQLDAPPQSERDVEKDLHIPFHTNAYRFRQGHRIRLSISARYWPMIWPTPGDGKTVLISGNLTLPVCISPPKPIAQPFPPALDLPDRKTHSVRFAPEIARFRQESEDGEYLDGWEQGFKEMFCSETQTAFGYSARAEYRVTRGDPLSAGSNFVFRARYTRPDGFAEIESALAVKCADGSLVLHGDLSTHWNGKSLVDKTWTKTIPRKLF